MNPDESAINTEANVTKIALETDTIRLSVRRQLWIILGQIVVVTVVLGLIQLIPRFSKAASPDENAPAAAPGTFQPTDAQWAGLKLSLIHI